MSIMLTKFLTSNEAKFTLTLNKYFVVQMETNNLKIIEINK